MAAKKDKIAFDFGEPPERVKKAVELLAIRSIVIQDNNLARCIVPR